MSDDITTRLIRARADDPEVTAELGRLREIILGVAHTIATGTISERATIDEGFMLPAAVHQAVARQAELARDAETERDRLRTVVEAVRPYMTLLPVEVAEGIVGIEPIAYADQERDHMRSALADISAAVLPDVGHGGNYGFVVTAAKSVVAERDRLRKKADEADVELTEFVDLITPLLHGTANALKGEPGPLHMHDWSDLPRVAGTVVTERDRLRAVLETIAGIPSGGTTLISPPTVEHLQDVARAALEAFDVSAREGT